MASDLKLRRYSIRTQKGYLYCAKCFAKHFMRSPAEMGSKEIRDFLLLNHNRGASALYAAGNVNSKLPVARAALQAADNETSQQATAAPDCDGIESLDWRQLFLRLTGIDLGLCPTCGCHLTSAPLAQSSHAPRAPPSAES